MTNKSLKLENILELNGTIGDSIAEALDVQSITALRETSKSGRDFTSRYEASYSYADKLAMYMNTKIPKSLGKKTYLEIEVCTTSPQEFKLMEKFWLTDRGLRRQWELKTLTSNEVKALPKQLNIT